MSLTRYAVLLVCLCIGLFTVSHCITQIIERKKEMNQHPKSKTSGSFLAHDTFAQPLILEWHQTSLMAPEFSSAMKSAWEIACPAYHSVEMLFLKAFPDVVVNEPYFKPFEQLFKNGLQNVDWFQAEQIMKNILMSHFIFDASTLSEEIKQKFAQDRCIVVSIKNKESNKNLGFITFLRRSTYEKGDIKVMSFAVDPAVQNRGLGKLLMSSILKIMTDVKRIFLCTRVTNDRALRAYQSWGFVKDLNPILDHGFNMNHWAFLEYKTTSSSTLQNTSNYLNDTLLNN